MTLLDRERALWDEEGQSLARQRGNKAFKGQVSDRSQVAAHRLIKWVKISCKSSLGAILIY